MLFWLLLTTVNVFPGLPEQVSAQTIAGGFQVEKNQKLAEALHTYLGDNPIPYSQIARRIFQKAYDPELADIFFFVDQTTSEPFGDVQLIHHGKNKKELFGQQCAYALILLKKNAPEKPILKDNSPFKTETKKVQFKTSQGDTTITLKQIPKEKKGPTVKLSPLYEKKNASDHALLSIFESLAVTFAGVTAKSGDEEKPPTDSTFSLELDSIGTIDNNKTAFYFGIVKIPLKEGTINRIRISEDENPQNVSATFGNYSGASIIASIALLYQPKRHDSLTYTDYVSNDSLKKREDIDELFPFLLAHIFIKKPRIPNAHMTGSVISHLYSKMSFSITLGLKLSKDHIFDDKFLGVTFGHLVGSAGLVLGTNLRDFQKIDKTQGHKGHFVIGINYPL
jgi:hypothetical protein